jgi:NADPH:quinone reductase-like Zn-dependent oxidoreductase
MAASDHSTGLQLLTNAKSSGDLELTLVRVENRPLKEDQVLVQIKATPINPSDLGLLVGPADLSTAVASGAGVDRRLVAKIPERLVRSLASRHDQPMPVGNEGAGIVVKAGASPEAQALLGKTVAVLGGSMYAQYRTLKMRDCMPLPADVSVAEGASCFVNPLTALGFVETMRREGYTGLVHTAAASNLGQMLNKICLKDGIPLVNIVRSAEQAKILRDIGATYIIDFTSPTFQDELTKAIIATGAMLGFDAIGGGKLANQILVAMEAAAQSRMKEYSRYGSSEMKQVYIYGGLDTGPSELTRSYGLTWGVGGWLLTPFLQKAGPEVAARLRARVLAELKTTFASSYTKTIPLTALLDVETLRATNRKATGEKYLIDPSLDG